MKRILTMILVICLCIGLCACGKEPEETEITETTERTEPTKSIEAQKADELILAIGEVSLEKESAILAAKAYYDTLTDRQKAEVENMAVLETAIEDLDALKKDEEFKQIYQNGLNFENSCLINDAYAEYEKLPSDYEDVAKRIEYLKPLVGITGNWLSESDTAVSNKGDILGTPAQSYYLEVSSLDGKGGGTFRFSCANNSSQYTNSSIFKGVPTFWELVKNGNTELVIQDNEDGSYTIGTHGGGKTGFGILTITFTITVDGKLAVEYSVNNDGDITTVVHTYVKP